MQNSTIDVRDGSFTDDSSAALGLSHDAGGRRIFSRSSMVEHPITKTPTQRAELVVLPDAGNDCRADLVGKSPDEMAKLLTREAEDDRWLGTEREMQQVPGGRDPRSHSSSGGRRAKKPNPRPDFSGGPIRDFEAPAKFRPHNVSGKVSTEARHGLFSQGVTTGEMFNLLGETLHVGVSWTQIEFMLRELQAQQRVA